MLDFLCCGGGCVFFHGGAGHFNGFLLVSWRLNRTFKPTQSSPSSLIGSVPILSVSTTMFFSTEVGLSPTQAKEFKQDWHKWGMKNYYNEKQQKWTEVVMREERKKKRKKVDGKERFQNFHNTLQVSYVVFLFQLVAYSHKSMIVIVTPLFFQDLMRLLPRFFVYNKQSYLYHRRALISAYNVLIDTKMW